MKIKIDGNFCDEGRSALLCPRCGDNTLHLSSILLTVRDSEDNAGASIVDVRGIQVSDLYAETKAPFEVMHRHTEKLPFDNGMRRNEIKLFFDCELCSGPVDGLTITQHKGSTLIGWSK